MCSQGCVMGLRALLLQPRSRQKEDQLGRKPEDIPVASREGASGPPSTKFETPMERQVQDALKPHFSTLQEAVLHELEGAVECANPREQ
ncbi:PRKG2 [Symbiodinium necroappetens]|uniref:PRKG2 protein n=1 Tax=Symbiodinium necroappetens TaxID=1628268 RepID=A0A812ZVH1_9DINO|nr:PRKG2 [Symbiodinium necroappetens]